MSERVDFLFQNATLIDGTGAPARTASVAVADGVIAAIDPDAPVAATARTVIDAAGLMLTPGFIDLHCHSDFAVLLYPECTSKIAAGVTTEVDGNCGMSAVPLRGEVKQRRQKDYARDSLPLDWDDMDGYAACVTEHGTAVNRVVLVGHGNLRGQTVGYDARPATRQELDAMCGALADSLDAGAFGLTTGLIYPPGCFADVDELAALCRVVADRGGFYASHMRNEGDTLEEAVDEFLEVSRRSGVRANISHLKVSRKCNWPKIGWLRDRLFRARDEGLQLTADRYPYTASHTSLDSFILPKWAFDGGVKAEMARLTDPTDRAELRQAVLDFVDDGYWDRLTISTVSRNEHREFEGLTMAAIAEKMGLDPIEAAFNLIVAEEGQTAGNLFSMSEDNLREILSWPFVAIGSDSGLKAPPADGVTGKPHPRAFGTPSRVLARFTRDEGLLSWEQAIHKLTGLPARTVGLTRRGVVAEGSFADLCVFDPAALADNATYEAPRRLAGGMAWVLVNGEPVVRDGEFTHATPGRVLRGKDA